MNPVLDQLITLSRTVGAPAMDAAILGEGNTSARIGDETFLVKASGCQLGTMAADDLVELRFDRILPLLGRQQLDESELSAAYAAAKVDPTNPRRPSVEALFHAALLALPGVRFVAHTHPTAINGLTCSTGWPAVLQGRMFPDEAVVLGPDSVFVPYVDPGLVLAKAIRDGVETYRVRHDAVPKVVYLQNHGVIALGSNPTEAANITAMAIKAARIRAGALVAGGIRTLDTGTVAHLLQRPDERYRQAQLASR